VIAAAVLGLAGALAAQDTLRLGPGTHPGPLVLERPTVVIGAPGAVLRGGGRGTVLTILGSGRGSVVRGVRIEGSGRDLDRDDAGVLVWADSITLEDLVLRDVLHGVYVRNAADVTLRRLDIAGPPGLSESAMGNGIHLWSVRRVTVTGARIATVRDGLFLEYADSVDVRDSHVQRVRFGIHYMFSHYNRFAGNVFSDNAAGGVIMNSRRVAVTDNVFAWNAGSRSYGLVLQTATAPVVRDNLIVGNGVGVFFDNVIRGTFTGNVVAGNWLGLELFGNSEQTRVTDNAIHGNTFDASGGAAAGAYTWCVDGRGNYWSAAAAGGYDLDGDGVLDAPHAATAALAELARRRAGLRLFLGSPAARALDWAERTFPVFDVAGAEDPCPLAAPPQPAMVARLPEGPGGGGGRGGQGAAGAAVLGAGLTLLVVLRRGSRR
jgi:nitrous oxidase accessory protein